MAAATFTAGAAFLASGCAYQLGSPDRSIPGGYQQLSIPMFRNLTQETGIEVSFTNALIREFERSKTARVVDPPRAEAEVNGVITEISYVASGDVSSPSMPLGAVLRAGYSITVKVTVVLRRRSDQVVLWTGDFQGEHGYIAPQVTRAGINTVNPLYNLSARRQYIDLIAAEAMAEAHNRMSENF
ncbi:MAG: hypothetical protein C5B49_07015 [Bdellovibrio sp.]|nr:MAG: hypothetical protein C5B49_07015 [Bdellovibrio sp.]